jgi:hypothetical protein
VFLDQFSDIFFSWVEPNGPKHRGDRLVHDSTIIVFVEDGKDFFDICGKMPLN